MARYKASIVIVDYHDGEAVQAQATSVLEASSDYQVVVVRNDCPANEPPLVASAGTRYMEIRSPLNLGFAQGFNLALPHLEGEVTLSLNADILISADQMRELLIEANESASIVSPVLFNEEGRETGRKFYSVWGVFSARSKRGRASMRMAGPVVDWVLGGCLALRTDLLIALRGFSNQFFLYFEDVDLCWRAKEAGISTTVSSLEVYHAHGRASHKLGKPLFWHVQSAVTFFRRHPRAAFGRQPIQALDIMSVVVARTDVRDS